MLPLQEALYEDDLGAMTAAAGAVAQLFADPRARGVLQGHLPLLQALARLLREDAKKSTELCASLLAAFFELSRLPAAHALLAQVGPRAEGRGVHRQGPGRPSRAHAAGSAALHVVVLLRYARPPPTPNPGPPALFVQLQKQVLLRPAPPRCVSPTAEPGGLPHYGTAGP